MYSGLLYVFMYLKMGWESFKCQCGDIAFEGF